MAGAPRLAALVDLDPAAGGPLLALSVDRPGGRVSGELVPATGVLPAALRHLTDDVLPALAHRPTAGPPGAPAHAPAAPAHATAGPGQGPGQAPAADPAATQVVSLAELEQTRQLTATVSAQRDRLAADRDRIARSRDDAVADRDRLRRDHDVLARRLDRLEREAGLRRPAAAEREKTAMIDPVRREPTLVLAPARREPTRGYEPEPRPAPRPSTLDSNWWRGTAPARTEDRPSTPDTPRPAPRKPLFRRTRRAVRRLITLVVVLVVLAIGAVVGGAALLNTSPDLVLDKATVVLEQVRNGGT